MGKVRKGSKTVYEDNVGDLYYLNTNDPKILNIISKLDDLLTDSIGYFDIHHDLTNAWDEIMEKYETADVSP